MNLLTQNSKLKKTSKETGERVFNFGIPAYKDGNGRLTCPFADKDNPESPCFSCYATKGAYIWSNVKPAFQRRYELSKTKEFILLIIDEIDRKKATYVRVHDSGDYYSREYVEKWLEIARKRPEVKFYSYTKSFPLFDGVELPENYDIIFSDGSKDKRDITKYRHSKVFKSKSDLIAAGYVDASKNDLACTRWFNPSKKVGLIFH